MNDFRMHVSIKWTHVEVHSPLLNISMQIIIVNRCRSQLLMNFLFSLYTCIFRLFYLLNSSWVSKFTDVLLLNSLKVSSLKFTLVSVSDKRISRSLYTLWSTCLNTIYHHYRHHHRLPNIEKVRRENHIKCFQLETRNIFSSVSLSAKVCIFSFSIALGKYQHWILLKFLQHSEKAFFFYWITAISNITLYMQMLKWKFNFSICKHLINFRVAWNAWKNV